MGKIVRKLAWVLATILLGCAAQAPDRQGDRRVSAEQRRTSPALPQADSDAIQPLTVSLGEVWIIERPSQGIVVSGTPPPWPGSATLITRRGAKTNQCPLSNVDVHARVTGTVAAVSVLQKFFN